MQFRFDFLLFSLVIFSLVIRCLFAMCWFFQSHMFRFQAMNLECAISRWHEIIIQIGKCKPQWQTECERASERQKKCFNFNLSYIIYSQFETFDALLIDKIQDIDKYVEAHFGCAPCESIVFNERALHRNQCLWCSAKGWKRRSTEERQREKSEMC